MGSVGRSPESVLVGKRTRILCTSGLRVGCMPCYDAELRMLVSYRPLANSRETFDDVEQEYPRQHGRGLYIARLGKFLLRRWLVQVLISCACASVLRGFLQLCKVFASSSSLHWLAVAQR